MIPLHSHADPEIFYVLDASLEVFQAKGPSEGWQTINAGNVVSSPEMAGTRSEIFLPPQQPQSP